jgi:hypothetical protein
MKRLSIHAGKAFEAMKRLTIHCITSLLLVPSFAHSLKGGT